MLPSWTKSSTPVTVAVCGVFQLAGGKGRVGGSAGPLAGFRVVRAVGGVGGGLLVGGGGEGAVGWLVRTMVKLAAPPASVVTKPDVGLTVMPAVSLSVLVALTFAGLRPL